MTLAELASLVRRFEDCTLPREEWAHRAHLSVAAWYLAHHSRDDATARIREGIQRYNESLGNAKVYHETITLSWIALIACFLQKSAFERRVAELATEVNERFGTSDYLLRHFSKEWLFSDAARAQWVEPDLAPLA